MTQTLEVEKTDIGNGGGIGPRVMHIIKRDGTPDEKGPIIYPMVALCGYVCRESLGGPLAGGVVCPTCKELAVKIYGAVPTR